MEYGENQSIDKCKRSRIHHRVQCIKAKPQRKALATPRVRHRVFWTCFFHNLSKNYYKQNKMTKTKYKGSTKEEMFLTVGCFRERSI